MSGGTFTGIDNSYLDVLLECHPRTAKIALAMARRHNGRNNGDIAFSVRDACNAISSNRRLACEALTELQDKSLIECTRQASFDFKAGAQGRQARRWKLNFVWEKKK